MLARLLFFTLLYGAFFAAPLYFIGAAAYKLLEPGRERRKLQKAGEANAKLLLSHEENECFYCLKECGSKDCYDKTVGWYHADCLKQLLG